MLKEGALRLHAGGGAQRNPCSDAYDKKNPEGVTIHIFQTGKE